MTGVPGNKIQYEPGEYPEDLEIITDPITGDVAPFDPKHRIPETAALAKHVDVLTKEVLKLQERTRAHQEDIYDHDTRIRMVGNLLAQNKTKAQDRDKEIAQRLEEILNTVNTTKELQEGQNLKIEGALGAIDRILDRLDLLESGLQYVEKRLPKEQDDPTYGTPTLSYPTGEDL